METQYSSITVAELVVKDFRNADVFKKYGIDFCCGGKKPLSQVCAERSLDQNELERELKVIESLTGLPSQNYDNWPIDFLAEYIVRTHHQYVRTSISVLQQYLEKVARVHGHYYTETVRIAELFSLLAADLTHHMMKEENLLFPYIKELAKAKGINSTTPPTPFVTVQHPIRMMEKEHDGAGDLIKEIQKLSNNFTPPEEACNTFRVSYAKLNEFEQDLFMHIHLENNILFPKAIELERERGHFISN